MKKLNSKLTTVLISVVLMILTNEVSSQNEYFEGNPELLPLHQYRYHNNDITNGVAEMTVQTGGVFVHQPLQHGFNGCNYDWAALLEAMPQYQMEQMRESIAEKQGVLQQITDGGNTQLLLSEVDAANYAQAMALYHSLLSESPALSEEVMVRTIQQEYALPNALLAMVLASNPQASKSIEVKQALDEKAVPLDSYQMAQVMQGQYWQSEKEAIEREISIARANIEMALFAGICSNQSNEDYINQLDASHTNECLIKADMHYRTGNPADAEALLMTAMQYKGSELQTAQINTYSELMQLQYAIQRNEPHQWTAAEIAYIESVWQNNTDGCGTKANVLLHAYLGYELDVLAEVADTRSEEATAWISETKEESLQLWPNPANSLLQVKLVQPQPEATELTIADLTGRILWTQTIEESQMQTLVGVTALPINNYILSIRNARGDVIYSAPFIKN